MTAVFRPIKRMLMIKVGYPSISPTNRFISNKQHEKKVVLTFVDFINFGLSNKKTISEK